MLLLLLQKTQLSCSLQEVASTVHLNINCCSFYRAEACRSHVGADSTATPTKTGAFEAGQVGGNTNWIYEGKHGQQTDNFWPLLFSRRLSPKRELFFVLRWRQRLPSVSGRQTGELYVNHLVSV